jgi:glutamyl/glutaminyl-tRNA synthetase
VTFRSRIAPTPSGFLHEGNITAFLYTWLLVQKANGELLLRIDDLDNERFREAYLTYIFDALEAAGISYQLGPKNAADFQRHWSQQLRLPMYEAYLQQLWQTGQLYACTCSRQQIAKLDCSCMQKKLPQHTAQAAWRLHIPDNTNIQWHDDALGDVQICLNEVQHAPVMKRSNGLPAYHIASIADDVHFGINCIVRGEDLLSSTALQLYITSLLQLDAFLQCRFIHHPLMLNETGKKISKSAGDESLLHPPEFPDVQRCMQQIIEWFPLQFSMNKKATSVADLLKMMV